MNEPSRLAVCAWCDRELSVRYSESEGFYIYPMHNKLGTTEPCKGGSRAAVPVGAFRQ